MTGTAEDDDALIDGYLSRYRTWGRWGTDDQAGTLNHLGPQSVRQAQALIDDGGILGLGRPIAPRSAQRYGPPTVHLMTELPSDSITPRGTSSDWYGLACHGFDITHLDGLCHMSWRGYLYNGFRADEVTARGAAPSLTVETLSNGVFAPAVVVDVPRLRGVPWLEPGDGIDADDLARVVQNCPWSEGTVLIVSTGRDAREHAGSGHDPVAEGNPGLLPSVVPWLHEHQPSLLVTDVACDRMRPEGAPHSMPVHVLALVGLGIHLIDNASLAELTKLCADRERSRVAFSLSVPRFVRGTGAPVNPLVIY